jgi:hypothetical protein
VEQPAAVRAEAALEHEPPEVADLVLVPPDVHVEDYGDDGKNDVCQAEPRENVVDLLPVRLHLICFAKFPGRVFYRHQPAWSTQITANRTFGSR